MLEEIKQYASDHKKEIAIGLIALVILQRRAYNAGYLAGLGKLPSTIEVFYKINPETKLMEQLIINGVHYIQRA